MSLYVILKKMMFTEIYSENITHNLNVMAEKAGIYQELWRPDEIGITKARQLVEPLKKGLEILKSNPKYFKELNPSNGWGSYEYLVKFVENYLRECKKNPTAVVKVIR